MFKNIVIWFLLFSLVGPVFAIDLGQMNLNLPNIQDVQVSEQSGPKSMGDIVLESPIDEKSYRLGPGDLLSIHIIVGESDLFIDHTLLVGADGKIFFPNIGEIYLSGLSLKEAREKIDQKIKSVYPTSYNLYILLSQPKRVKIYVAGMIKSPGPLSVYDNMRVSEVLSLAGGVVSGGSNRYVYIKRKGFDNKTSLIKADLFEAYRGRDLSKDYRIQAGDIIEIPDSQNELVSQGKINSESDKLLFEGKETFVYVYGEVARAGRFEYIPGKKLSDYISFAGGPTGRALLGSVTLTRHIDNKPQKYKINVSDVLYNGNAENDVEIYGGDVINVPSNFFYVTDFSSFINTVLLGLTLYSTVIRK